MEKKKIYFSGIQPSGNLHLGNYLGSLRQWVDIQKREPDSEFIFCIVDLHAITVRQNPQALKNKIKELSALYLACGIDTKNAHIFVQSENLNHPYLAWIFDCFMPMGWLNRMTQYKDKQESQKDLSTVGLFNYPALMAADIVLYDTTHVPVGEDQIQHVELTRDIASKFNNTFEEIFTIPDYVVDKQVARIMSLQNPLKKMSKSDEDNSGAIGLLDSPDEIINKFKRAVTDSGSEIVASPEKAAISNMISIYSKLTGKSSSDIESDYRGKNYSQFKTDLAEVVANYLAPVQKKFHTLMDNRDELNSVLDKGAQYAIEKSSQKVDLVKKTLGLAR